MKWSFRIATVSGIPVFVHGTFLLLLVFILVNDLAAGLTLAAIVFDIMRRYLAYRGYKVTFVKNFTDIDDKIINRGKQEGIA